MCIPTDSANITSHLLFVPHNTISQSYRSTFIGRSVYGGVQAFQLAAALAFRKAPFVISDQYRIQMNEFRSAEHSTVYFLFLIKSSLVLKYLNKIVYYSKDYNDYSVLDPKSWPERRITYRFRVNKPSKCIAYTISTNHFVQRTLKYI